MKKSTLLALSLALIAVVSGPLHATPTWTGKIEVKVDLHNDWKKYTASAKVKDLVFWWPITGWYSVRDYYHVSLPSNPWMKVKIVDKDGNDISGCDYQDVYWPRSGSYTFDVGALTPAKSKLRIKYKYVMPTFSSLDSVDFNHGLGVAISYTYLDGKLPYLRDWLTNSFPHEYVTKTGDGVAYADFEESTNGNMPKISYYLSKISIEISNFDETVKSDSWGAYMTK